MTLAIAIVALLAVAGVGAYVRFAIARIEAAVAELAESMESDEEAEPEAKEPPHIWVSDGECYIADMPAFLASINAVGVCNEAGVPCAVIPGVGVVSLHKLFSEQGKPVKATKLAAVPQ